MSADRDGDGDSRVDPPPIPMLLERAPSITVEPSTSAPAVDDTSSQSATTTATSGSATAGGERWGRHTAAVRATLRLRRPRRTRSTPDDSGDTPSKHSAAAAAAGGAGGGGVDASMGGADGGDRAGAGPEAGATGGDAPSEVRGAARRALVVPGGGSDGEEVAEPPKSKARPSVLMLAKPPIASQHPWGPEHSLCAGIVSDGLSFSDAGAGFESETPLRFTARHVVASAVCEPFAVQPSPDGCVLFLRLRQSARDRWRPGWKLKIAARRIGHDWKDAGSLTFSDKFLRIELPSVEGDCWAQLAVKFEITELLRDDAPSVIVRNATSKTQYCTQSSVDADHWGKGDPFMYRTMLEWEPFWDMATSRKTIPYLVRLRFSDTKSKVYADTGGPAPRIRYRISTYTYLEDNVPSNMTTVVEVDSSSDPIDVPLNRLGLFVRISIVGAYAVLQLDSADIFVADVFGPTLQSTWRNCFAIFHERTLFGERADRRTALSEGDGGSSVEDIPHSTPLTRRLSDAGAAAHFVWCSYGDVKRRVDHFLVGLEARVGGTNARQEGDRLFVTIMGRNSTDWCVSDLACALGGHVSVPLAFTSDDEVASFVVTQTGSQVVVVAAEQASTVLRAVLTGSMPSLKLFVAMDGARPDDGYAHAAAATGLTIVSMVELEHLGAELIAEAATGGSSLLDRPDPDQSTLCSLLYTSGSTGMPKGAMRSYEAFNTLLQNYGAVQPAVHVSFAPLSHLSERVMLPTTMLNGGQIAFVDPGPSFYDDIRSVQPTFINAVPRFFNRLYTVYQEELQDALDAESGRKREEVEASVMSRFRHILGSRLQSVSIGSAPPVPAVVEWMKEVFKPAKVNEGYGSTECGTITINDVVAPSVTAKLVDVPELGYLTTDTPPRGEVWVKTKTMISGYYKNEEKTAEAFAEDGWFRTGDVAVEEVTPSGKKQLRLIGRAKNVIKLSNGEFVEPERIETLLLRNPLLEQIHVHASGTQSTVVAIVVPCDAALRRTVSERGIANAAAPLHELCSNPAVTCEVMKAIAAEARDAGLLPYQTPGAVLLHPEKFTPENSLMTSSSKPNRPAIERVFEHEFAALYEQAVSFEAQLAAIMAEVGVGADGTGGMAAMDSLTAARITSTVRDRTGVEVPVSAFVSEPGTSFEDLTVRVRDKLAGGGKTQEAVRLDIGDTAYLTALDSLMSKGVPRGTAADVAMNGADASQLPLKDVFLTGATGFLGAFLLDELLKTTSSRIHCLARVNVAPDDPSANEKARDRVRDARLAAGLTWDAACESRVVGVAGDLSRPSLGLSDDGWSELAAKCDLIVHNGAIVHWVYDYLALRAANVGGTLEVIRLAATTKLKPVVYVSTISTTPVGGSEADLLDVEETIKFGGGYVVSKFVAELHLERAAQTGLPVVVLRPGMVTGHSVTGHSNTTQFVDRYLVGCVELGAYVDDPRLLDLSPVDWVAKAAVHLATHTKYFSRRGQAGRQHTFLLTLVDRAMRYNKLGAAIADHGYQCRPLAYSAFRERLVRAQDSRLAPLLSFFPESGFSLGVGPYNASSTLKVLAGAGIDAPDIGEALIHTYLTSLVLRGVLHEADVPEGLPDETLTLLRQASGESTTPTDTALSLTASSEERVGFGVAGDSPSETSTSRAAPSAAGVAVPDFLEWIQREVATSTPSMMKLNEQVSKWMQHALARDPLADLRDGMRQYSQLVSVAAPRS